MSIAKSQVALLLVAFLLMAGFLVLCAEDKPAPTVESLTADVKRLNAENESLKAQLAQLQGAYSYDAKVCGAALQAAREFVVGKPTPKESAKPKP